MKYIFIVLLLLTLVPTINAQEFGKFDGLVRFYNIFSPSYVKSGRAEEYAIDGSTIGGHLRYNSPKYFGIGATTALYYSTGTGLNNKDDKNTIVAAARFFTSDYSSKAVLGELNIHYKYDNHYAVLGRLKIDSPLTNSISTYMPSMFESFLYKNSSLPLTTITIAQVDKMAYATRTPVEFGLIGETTRTAGATQAAMDNRGKFRDIEKQVLDDSDAKTDGVTILGVESSFFKNTTIRAWDIYAHDIINMFYLDAEYKNEINSLNYSLSAQYLSVESVGRNLASDWMDSKSAYLTGIKGSVKYKKSFFYIAYNHSGNSKLLNPFGGNPAYTSSIFSSNAYRANVDAFKTGFHYDISEKIKFMGSYADYGQSTTLGTFSPSKPVEAVSLARGDAIEYDILLSYNPIKQLNILGAIIYKTSEYFYADKQVQLLDLDLVITYKF